MQLLEAEREAESMREAKKLAKKRDPDLGQISGLSPHFERKKYPWLSDKEHQTRKPEWCKFLD